MIKIPTIYNLQSITTLHFGLCKEAMKVFSYLESDQYTYFKDIEHLKCTLIKRIGNIPLSPLGIDFNNKEQLNLISNDKGRTIISSGVELCNFVYRGQTQFFDECKPNIFRSNLNNGGIDLLAKLIDVTKAIVFEEALDFHPYINLVNDRRKLEHYETHPNEKFRAKAIFVSQCLHEKPFYVNKYGLSQHYGFSTSLLDTTSNLDVAAFFATCEYDTVLNEYVPIERKECGVFYVIAWFYEDIIDKFDFIGWQPLPMSRPEEQRACSFKLLISDNLNKMPHVFKFRFEHDKNKSRDIYNLFCSGENNLFARDKLMDKVVEDIKNEHEFDEKHLRQAYNRLLEYFPNQIESYETMLEAIKKRTDEKILITNNIDLKKRYMNEFQDKDYRADFTEVINKVVVRPVIY